MPSLTVSTDTLQFDTIQCGLCQVITVQLYNDGPVPCEWSVRLEERPKKVQAFYTTQAKTNFFSLEYHALIIYSQQDYDHVLIK